MPCKLIACFISGNTVQEAVLLTISLNKQDKEDLEGSGVFASWQHYGCWRQSHMLWSACPPPPPEAVFTNEFAN